MTIYDDRTAVGFCDRFFLKTARSMRILTNAVQQLTMPERKTGSHTAHGLKAGVRL
jgi:hypothetical protein